MDYINCAKQKGGVCQEKVKMFSSPHLSFVLFINICIETKILLTRWKSSGHQPFFVKLSLSLRDRDRAETIITFHHNTTTSSFLMTLEFTYTQVWYIIGIVFSSHSYFCTENRVNWGHYSPPLPAIGLKYVYLVVDLISQSDLIIQSNLVRAWLSRDLLSCIYLYLSIIYFDFETNIPFIFRFW